MSFVGFVVKPGENFSYTVPEDVNLILTQAATNQSATSPTTLWVSARGVGKIVLCTLHWGHNEQSKLDLMFESERELEFSVSGGNGQIHLTGYTVTEEQFDDDDMDDLNARFEGEFSSEEEKEEAEKPPKQPKKNKDNLPKEGGKGQKKPIQSTNHSPGQNQKNQGKNKNNQAGSKDQGKTKQGDNKKKKK